MNTIIYRKSDLKCVGTVTNNMTIEEEIELNVIPNFGGSIEDYDSVITDKINFHLERQNENVVVVENIINPIIIEESPSLIEIEFAEYVIATEDRIAELENKINELVGGK